MGKTAILSVKILGDAAGAKKSFGEVDAGLDRVSDNAGKMGEKLGLAGVAAGAALTKGLLDEISADGATRKLAGQLGLTVAESEQVGAMAGSMYADAYGSSLEEVNSAIAGVSSTLADLSANGGADVDRLSKKALDAAGTFDLDLAGAISTAGTLMKTGLAADGDEAFDLLVGSMQKMPQAMQAELLPVMDEYSKHFADLGIDGTTALGMVANASQDGAIGMDKMGDSLKELTIRATDGSATTTAAYEAIGLSNDEMTAKMLAGGDQANDAFGQIVHGLQGIEDPAAQSAAAIALFGTPLEDLGTAGIPDFLGAIDPMGDAFDSVAGSADELSATINTGPAVAVEEMKRGMLASLQETAAGAMPLITPMIDLLSRFAPVLGPLAVVIAVVAAAVRIASTAQTIWNAALIANPIGIVVALIVALVAGIVLAYQNIGWFKDAVNTAGAIAGAVFGTIIGWVSNLIGWIVNVIANSQTFQAVIGLLGVAFDAAGAIGQKIIGWIVAGFTNAVDWVKSVTTESDVFMGILSGLGEIGKSVFGAIDTAISSTIGWVKDAVGWFGSLFGAKNDAASVQVDGGGAGSSGGFAAPASLLRTADFSTFAAADPLALAYGAAGAASYAAPARSVASGLTSAAVSALTAGRASAAAAPSIHNTFQIEVAATPGTDRVALGRELVSAIRTYERATGKTGGTR